MKKTILNVSTFYEDYIDFKREADITYKNLKEAVNRISLEEFASLPYAKMKEIYNIILSVPQAPIRDEVMCIFAQKREETFPFLKHAVYFPCLNKIDFIPEDLIKKIDRFLSHYKIKEYINQDVLCRCGISKSDSAKVLDFLVANGVIVSTDDFINVEYQFVKAPDRSHEKY